MGHVKLGEGDPKRGKFRSICSIHQEMYHILKEHNELEDQQELLDLLEEAFNCGIKMDRKLTEYAQKWKTNVYKRRDK